MERLLPDRGPTTVREQLEGFDPVAMARRDRPYTFTNFAVTVDGRATIDGRAGPIGSGIDTDMLVGLRSVADAVMLGAGTMRAERYGRMVVDPQRRELRERRGLAHDPLAVLISGRLDLPWEAPLFTCGSGEVLIFTASGEQPPATETPVGVVRHAGRVDLADVVGHLRSEQGVRALLCEGGPRLHGELVAAGLVDEIFLTSAPRLAGGDGPGLLTGLPVPADPLELELAWLLHEEGELFARYRVLSP